MSGAPTGAVAGAPTGVVAGTPSPEGAARWRRRRWRRLPRIEIRDLRVIGVHGVLPEERTRAQPFSLDIDAWVDRTAESAVDMVEDTVDYSVLVQRAAGIVESSSFQLLESVATAIASSLLESDHRLEAVEVVVRKLRPPMPFHIASVGVRCFRRRRDADGRRADLVADRAPS